MKIKILNMAIIIVIISTNLIVSIASQVKPYAQPERYRSFTTLPVLNRIESKYYSKALNLWKNDPKINQKLKAFILLMKSSPLDSRLSEEDRGDKLISEVESLTPEELSYL